MERWKTVEGTDGMYLVSDMGRVMSKASDEDGMIMKPYLDRKGYNYVEIKGKNTSIHRLVAKAFIDNPEGKKEVNHINGDKNDNRADNLEWATRSENISHAYKTGLKCNPLRGESIKAKKVLCIDTGVIYECLKDAEEATGALQPNITKCCYGERKTAGGYHWKYA